MKMTNVSSVKNQGTWHAIVPISNVSIAMNMVMLQQTVQTKYHHQVHLHDTEIIILAHNTILDPYLAIINGTDTGLIGQDHIPAVTDTDITAKVIHREVIPGHITGVCTEAHLTTYTQTLIIIDGTHHIGDLHHTEALLHILEIAVGLNHIPHTNQPIWHLLNPLTALTRQPGNTRIRNINKSPLMTPHLIITALMNHPVSQMRI